MRFGLFSLLCFILLGCDSGQPSQISPPSDKNDWPSASLYTATDLSTLAVTLDRGGCYGECPIYTVTAKGTGEVFLNGEEYTSYEGATSWTVNQDAIRSLIAEFERAEFLKMKDEYIHSVTDAAGAIITLSFEGKTKSVSHYPVDWEPERLTILENRIDEILGTHEYIRGISNKVDPEVFQSSDLSAMEIRLARGPCGFSKCPYYSVAAKGNGTVTFQGEANTSTLGEAEWEIPLERFQELLAEFEQTRFLSIRTNQGEIETVEYWTDQSCIQITLMYRGNSKIVYHCLGEKPLPPNLQFFNDLADKVDDILGTRPHVSGRVSE